MARGEYCAAHNRYFGNIIPCEECERERHEKESKEQLRLVTWEEWMDKYLHPPGKTEVQS